jgi:hypothetical protein
MEIKEAAILYNNKIYTGLRHYIIINYMKENGISIPIIGEQGFITDDYKFVDRKEAYYIALKANQIKEKRIPRLFSEDLY